MPKGVAYHPRATRSDWNTPNEVTEPLYRFAGRAVLDPCCNARCVVTHDRSYRLTDGEDGLALPWASTAFVNPPFCQLRRWAAKCAAEAKRGVEILLLTPARTDTVAWQDYVSTADCVLLWRGRLTFLGAEQPAPFPVAIAYWGDRVERFRSVFGRYGLIMMKGRESNADSER